MSKTDPRFPVLILFAIVFTFGLSFATLEAPVVLNNILGDYLDFPDFNPAIEAELIEEFLRSYYVRSIGYACLSALIILIIVGFVTKKTGLSTLGSVAFFLPIFGYFVAYMFFLSGLGILRILWIPIWEPSTNLLKLGDITYLPYMVVVYPLTLVSSLFGIDVNSPLVYHLQKARLVYYYWDKFHVDARVPLAYVLIGLGLFIFFLGTIAWLYARFVKKKIIDFWIYRISRHPQYLGWLIWSYGLMLLASYMPVVRGGENPGASLPWLISSLLVICIALVEEIKMVEKYGKDYTKYRDRAPFMLPLPRFISSAITFPIRTLFKKDRPENFRQIFITFLIYAIILIILSLPFVILNWPSGPGWSEWPYNMWPFRR